MGTDGIADFGFGDASLQSVGGIGKICLVPFALSGKQIGEVGVFEKLKFGPWIFLKSDAYLSRPLHLSLIHIYRGT